MGFDLSINASAISAFGASMGRSVVCSKRLPHTPSVTMCYENRWRVTGLSQVSACKRAAVPLVLFCVISVSLLLPENYVLTFSFLA